MQTTQIPNEKVEQVQTFSIFRCDRSDFQLMTDLLEIVSNSILFEEIVSITPTYRESGLMLAIRYSTYL